jgi:hypothetical protein
MQPFSRNVLSMLKAEERPNFSGDERRNATNSSAENELCSLTKVLTVEFVEITPFVLDYRQYEGAIAKSPNLLYHTNPKMQ